ncbi:MAG: hypothetical protein MUF69_11215 [Desulfobacterota bacterium]|nr:hypothetical protein [Thermodesulfobacteriota bacterium]
MNLKLPITVLLVLLLGGAGPAAGSEPVHPDRPLAGGETARKDPVPAPAKGASQKSSAAASPKQQIKEGGREIGRGFKDLGVGLGRGFKNMGQAFKKAWTGGKED